MFPPTRSSAARKGKKPPRKKKKNPSPTTTEPTSISSLPYDLLLNCLARISRSYHPNLSLVSKKFHSMVASPELSKTRSLIDRRESCLYLCLRFPRDPNPDWFTLRCKPNRGGNRLVQIPSPHSPHATSVAVGSNIYLIGGDMSFSSRVSILDCGSHTWHQAPSMRVERRSSSTASLVDGKIYVAGGCEDLNSLNWIEVFDPKTQTWGSITNPCREIRDGRVLKSLGLEEKFYLFGDDQFVVYNSKECRWNSIEADMNMGLAVRYSYGVIDNVLFFWNDGVFKWYDHKVSLWKILNGVEGLPDFRGRGFCKMVDLGGKMAVLWDDHYEYRGGYMETEIWCAEIALEHGDEDDICGNVEWFDVVLKVDNSCGLSAANALSVIV